jgi:hypothetical protein
VVDDALLQMSTFYIVKSMWQMLSLPIELTNNIGNVRQKGKEGVIKLEKWGDIVVRWSLRSKMRSILCTP